MRGAPDSSEPTTYGLFDVWTGGWANTGADRRLAAELERRAPASGSEVRAARNFTIDAALWAARHGISQVIECEAWLPGGRPPLHDLVRVVRPAARVLYAQSDPVPAGYLEDLAKGDDGAGAVHMPPDDAAALLAAPEAARLIDPEQPAAVILEMFLHFRGSDAARRIVAGWADALAPGSVIIVSAGVPNAGDEAAREFTRVYTPAQIRAHSVEDVAGWLGGLELVAPGITDARTWRGWGEARLTPRPVGRIVAAVAVVPGSRCR
jgi:S-adenosyl methyltransferase